MQERTPKKTKSNVEPKMLINKELIQKIKDYFSLNIYETKVWLALLGKGVASAGQVAEISRVPRSRTYDVLESLEKKGFAIVKLGKPVKYIGVKPKIVLEKLKNNIKKDADERISSMVKLHKTEEFAQLEELYKGGIEPLKREDLSASLRGRSNISNYLKEIINNAEKEVIICTSAEDFGSKLKLFKQTIEVLKQKGVKVKVALSGEDKMISKINSTLGTRTKKISIDAKFFIIDKKEILFYLSKNSAQEEKAIWMNSEFFVQAFVGLFEGAINRGK